MAGPSGLVVQSSNLVGVGSAARPTEYRLSTQPSELSTRLPPQSAKLTAPPSLTGQGSLKNAAPLRVRHLTLWGKSNESIRPCRRSPGH